MSIILTIIILGGLAVLAGIVLSVAAVVMAVPSDEKADQIESVLPGVNCGACGFSGCSGYAAALSKGETADTSLCAPGGASTAKEIEQLLGVSTGSFVKRTAVVRCQGNWDMTDMKMEYKGTKTCAAANQLFSGLGACAYGCIGFGDCKAACEYDAITVENGLAKIDPDKCVACTKCVINCPKGLIKMMPSNDKAVVLCSNHDKGGKTRQICKVGCIGCMRCVKVCESDAVKVENFLAEIDADKCIGCGKCAQVCPQNCIIDY